LRANITNTLLLGWVKARSVWRETYYDPDVSLQSPYMQPRWQLPHLSITLKVKPNKSSLVMKIITCSGFSSECDVKDPTKTFKNAIPTYFTETSVIFSLKFVLLLVGAMQNNELLLRHTNPDVFENADIESKVSLTLLSPDKGHVTSKGAHNRKCPLKIN
jgi:hypothetical protein